MLILKVLLLVNESGSGRSASMVRKVNNGCILADYLSRQESLSSSLTPQQVYFAKAYIDFISAVYGQSNIREILEQVTGKNYTLEGYLLGRMWEKSWEISD